MRFGSYLVYIVYLDRYSLTHINFTIVTNELKRQAMYTNSQKKNVLRFCRLQIFNKKTSKSHKFRLSFNSLCWPTTCKHSTRRTTAKSHNSIRIN